MRKLPNQTNAQKSKSIVDILKSNSNQSEQNIANLIAFCVWSETMPCEENLSEVITSINLFYATNQSDLAENRTSTAILPTLFTSKLYNELLQNLKGLSDKNCIFAMSCICIAKYFKNKSTKLDDKYLEIIKTNDLFKQLLVAVLKI